MMIFPINTFTRSILIVITVSCFYLPSHACTDIAQKRQQPISYQYTKCNMIMPKGYIDHSAGEDTEAKPALLSKIIINITQPASSTWSYNIVEYYSTPYTQQELFQAPGNIELFSPNALNPNSKKSIQASCLGQQKIKLVHEYFQAQAPVNTTNEIIGVNLIKWIPLGVNSQIIEVTPQKLTISNFSNEYATGNPSQMIHCTR